jgi:hypothetical protein
MEEVVGSLHRYIDAIAAAEGWPSEEEDERAPMLLMKTRGRA